MNMGGWVGGWVGGLLTSASSTVLAVRGGPPAALALS